MSKKDFIALAIAIREHNAKTLYRAADAGAFTQDQLDTLANFCHSQNPLFKRGRWLDFIAGKCGPNGGSVKA